MYKTTVTSEHWIEGPENRRVCILFENGIRLVITTDALGESWTRYTIVPRRHLVRAIRERRRTGCSYHDCEWWMLLPDEFVRVTQDGGAGRSFSNDMVPYICNRRFIVFVQSGGLDV